MPTRAKAKQAFDAMSKDPNIYEQMNDEGKSAAWNYGRDNGYITRDMLSPIAQKEYDKHVTSQFTQYEPKLTKTKIQDNLKFDKYVGYQGAKTPLDSKVSTYPITSPIIKPKVTPKVTPKTTPTKIVPKALKQNTTLTTQAQRTGVNGRPLPLFDANKLDKAAGVVAPFAAGLSNVGGITEAVGLNNEYVKENPNKRFTTVNGRGIPVSLKLPDITPYNVGNLASMAFTGNLISKGVKPITKAVGKKLTKTIAKKVVPQAIDTVAQATGFTVPQDIIKGKSAKETLKDTALNTAMFTGMNVGLKGLGKLGKTVTKQAEVPKVIEAPKTIKPTKLINTSSKNSTTNTIKADDNNILYHGTWRKHKGFNNGSDFYFTDNKDYAKSYIREPKKGTDLGGELVGGKFKNDAKILDARTQEGKKIVDEIISNDDYMSYNGVEKYKQDNFNNGLPMFGKDDIAKEAKRRGFDAIVLSERDGIKSYRIFNPNSIESSVIEKPFNKRTTFIPNKQLSKLNSSKSVEQPNILSQATTPIGSKVNGTNATEPMPDTLGTISSSLDKKGVKHTVAKGYTEVIDNLDPINRVSKEAYQKALNTRQNDMLSHQILTNKLIDSKGNVIGDSLKDITKDIPIENKTEFADYLKARHAPSWIDQGRTVYPNELGMTSDLARQKAINYETIHPEFKEKADKLVKFQQDLTKKWLVDTGIMKEETWNGLIEKYPDYVPYARDFADIEKGGVYAKSGFVNQSNPIKKGVGSQRNTMDSVETIANRINQYVKIAKRNDVGKTLVNEIRNNPESFNGIAEIVTPKNAEMNSLVIDDINKILETDGIDGVVEKVNSSFENMFSAKKGGAIEKGNNIVTVLENGNPVHLKINDPDLLKAVASLDPMTIPKVFQAVGKGTNVMKTLTTGLNPAFGLARNIWRDLVTGYVNSSTINANPLGYAKYVWDLTRAVGNVLGEGAEKSIGKMLPESLDNLLKKSGQPMANFKNIGGGGHASNISADRNLFNDSIKSLYKQKLSVGKVLKATPKGIYKGLESLNNTMEVSPRLAEAKRQLKAGSSNDKALFESQDLTTNFSRHGDTGKIIDSFTPYFNAALQGLDKTIRQFNPAKIGTKQVLNSAAKAVYAVTIPTIILYGVNHKDEAYNMLSDYQKDNFFNIPNGDGTFKKIPKPREYGVVFGALPERLLRTFKENDPTGFNRFMENAIQNFAPPDPITENITSPAVRTLSTEEGRDWRNKPILNQNLLSLSPKLQYDENTSEFGKKIGDITNISPKKVDNLAKSYLGGVAQFGIPALTKGKNMSDVLKSQFNTDPLYNNDILNDFYKRYDSAKTSTADNNELNNIPSKVKTKQDIIVSKYKRDADYISKLQKMIKSETDKQKVKSLRELILEKAKASKY